MRKFLLAAVFAVGGILVLPADGLKVGAQVDFTDYLAKQALVTTNGASSWSDVTVRRSPWYTGSTFGRQDLYFKYDSDVWTFYTAFRFDQATTAISEAHLGLSLGDGLFKVKSGLFQEESFGYGVSTFAAGPMGRYLAASALNSSFLFPWRADSQYLTSVEFTPEEPSGLSVLVGIPLEPHGMYAGVFPTSTASPSALLKNNLNRFKAAAKFDLPDGGTVRAFYQNALFSNQAATAAADTANRKASYLQDLTLGIDEAFLGIDNLPVADGLTLKAGLDLQFDLALSGSAQQNQLALSLGWDVDPTLRLTLDNTVTMASPDWVDGNFLPGSEAGTKVYPLVSSGWVYYDAAVVKVSYNLDPVTLGLSVNGAWEPATNGHAYHYGQAYALPVNNGSDGSAYSVGASPTVTLLVGPGSLGCGLDFGYLSNTGTVAGASQTNSAFGWRVPVTYALSL